MGPGGGGRGGGGGGGGGGGVILKIMMYPKKMVNTPLIYIYIPTGKLQQTRKTLGGAVEKYTTDMKEAKCLLQYGHAVYCCLRAYSTQELLVAHATDCCHAQRTKFPEDPSCRFSDIQKPAPFLLYALRF